MENAHLENMTDYNQLIQHSGWLVTSLPDENEASRIHFYFNTITYRLTWKPSYACIWAKRPWSNSSKSWRYREMHTRSKSCKEQPGGRTTQDFFPWILRFVRSSHSCLHFETTLLWVVLFDGGRNSKNLCQQKSSPGYSSFLGIVERFLCSSPL